MTSSRHLFSGSLGCGSCSVLVFGSLGSFEEDCQVFCGLPLYWDSSALSWVNQAGVFGEEAPQRCSAFSSHHEGTLTMVG